MTACRLRALLFSVSAISLFAAEARAQAPAPAAPAAAAATGSETTIAEIVVTAEKREQNLQKVAAAVAAVPPEVLQRANVNDFTNITKVAPTITVTQAAGQTALEIRGIVTGSHDPTDESPNAVHIDGNYIARQNVINGLFYDIQRMEVLSGPQGTLYGRNAAGGAINIITNRPTFVFGGQGSVEFGNYNRQRFEAALNVPINDQLAIRFAGMSFTHDGYFRNGTDDANEHGARFEALWKPNDKQSLLITGDIETFSPKGAADNIVRLFPGSIQSLPPVRDNTNVPSSVFSNPAAAGSAANPTGVNTALSTYGDASRSFTNLQTQAGSLQYDYNLGFATVTLQYAHRRMSQNFQNYGGGGLTNTPEVSNTNTAELRLTSNETRPFQYVFGLYYFDEGSYGAQQTYGNITATTFASRAVLNDQAQSEALFGQVTYTPPSFDKLHLTLGGRLNVDKKTGTDDVIIVALNSHNPNVNVGHTWTTTDYKAGITYDVTPTSMLYASTATGSKAGGVAFGPFPIVPPEKNTAYEVGMKNRFFSNRLQLNVDAFNYHFTNPEFLTAATTVVNNVNVNTLEVITADYETMWGVEVDSAFLLTPNDRFQASANWLQARIHDLNYANPAYRVAGGLHLQNVPLFNAPDWTGRASYTHSWDAFDGRFEATASAVYLDAHTIAYPTAFNGLANSPSASIQALSSTLTGTVPPQASSPANTTVDFSLRYAPNDGRWSVTAYVDNITDKVYWIQGSRVTSGTNPLFNTIIADPSAPRTFGVIFSAKF